MLYFWSISLGSRIQVKFKFHINQLSTEIRVRAISDWVAENYRFQKWILTHKSLRNPDLETSPKTFRVDRLVN